MEDHIGHDRWLDGEEDRAAQAARREELRRQALDDDGDPEMAEDEDDYKNRVVDAATLAEMRWEEDTDR